MQAVFFDVYGTLIDFKRYKSPYSIIFRQIKDMNLKNKALEWVLTKNFETIEEFTEKLQKNFGNIIEEKFLIKKAEQELEEHLKSTILIEKAIDTLKIIKAKGYKIALISNLATPYKLPIKKFGLEDIVDKVFYSCDIGYKKPDHNIFHIALEDLDILPNETFMIGDNLQDDIIGANNIGIQSIFFDRDETASILLNKAKIKNQRIISKLEGILVYL